MQIDTPEIATRRLELLLEDREAHLTSLAQIDARIAVLADRLAAFADGTDLTLQRPTGNVIRLTVDDAGVTDASLHRPLDPRDLAWSDTGGNDRFAVAEDGRELAGLMAETFEPSHSVNPVFSGLNGSQIDRLGPDTA